jgi:hypothetical protein
MYKRYREESEAARMVRIYIVVSAFALFLLFKGIDNKAENCFQIEEEKALKQLRRTLVPHARPVPSFDRPFCPQKYENNLLSTISFSLFLQPS